jgi:hypothetical protein
MTAPAKSNVLYPPLGYLCQGRWVCYASKMNKKLSALQARSLLWKSLENGDLSQLEEALRLGVNPDSANGNWIPLGKALRRNHPVLAMALVKAGANLQLTDQGTCLISIAASKLDLENVTLLMLENGATPAADSLHIAARTGNTTVVKALLDRGLDPNAPGEQMGRHETPALALWPMHASRPPTELIAATFTTDLTDEATIEMISYCTREKNEVLFNLLATQPSVSARARNMLLSRCISAHWDAAVNTLLDANACDPIHAGMQDAPILGVIANRLRHGKEKTKSWALLARLMDYGYHPSAKYEQFCIGRGTPHYHVNAPVWLETIRSGPQAGRKRLINALIGAGANLDDRFERNNTPHAMGGLLHLLISLKDFQTLQWAVRTWPQQQWEHNYTPGVIATWAGNSCGTDMPIQLQRLLDMGFDPGKCDQDGRTPLRCLLERADINRLMNKELRLTRDSLHELACVLLSKGMDARVAGEDFQMAQSMGVDPSHISQWQALLMQQSNDSTPAKSTYKRPRL